MLETRPRSSNASWNERGIGRCFAAWSVLRTFCRPIARGGILPRHAALLSYGLIRLDSEGHRATLDGEAWGLTRTEFDLLQLLM